MTQTAFRYLAWASILGLFIITDTSHAFRPHTVISPSIDRFVALFLVGAVFSFAYPKHVLPIAALLLAVVIGFELLQRLLAGRHGYIKDMFVKGAGACAGVAAAVMFRRALSLFSRRAPPAP
jgi:glycopeptide antibiotics resistance protein